jgi:ribose 5-phosphate isomerase B
MHIIIGSDHAGFAIKQQIIARLQDAGHTTEDVGTHSEESCDFPDVAFAAGERLVEVLKTDATARGILLCGSGIGMSIAANKVKGVYAALATDVYMAAQGVEHDNANLLVLAARINTPEQISAMVEAFIASQFSTEEKYRRRHEKVLHYETNQ